MEIRKAIAAMLVGSAIGCASVQPVRHPDQFIPAKRPKQLWVTQADGKEWWLVNPRVNGDEVVGWARGRNEREVSVPLADAQLVQARQIDRGKTALAAGFALVAGGMFLHFVTRATSERINGGCDAAYPFSTDCY
jgi:hypothetical protein